MQHCKVCPDAKRWFAVFQGSMQHLNDGANQHPGSDGQLRPSANGFHASRAGIHSEVRSSTNRRCRGAVQAPCLLREQNIRAPLAVSAWMGSQRMDLIVQHQSWFAGA